MKKIKGFTLIELLIVVAIIGIIAAIAIPNMLDALNRANQKRTIGDLKTIASGIQQFSSDFLGYPNDQHTGALDPVNKTSLCGFNDPAGSNLFVPDLIQAWPNGDGWKNYYQYVGTAPAADAKKWPELNGEQVGRHFILASTAKDGQASVGTDKDIDPSCDPHPWTDFPTTWCVDAEPKSPNQNGATQAHCYKTDIVWGDSSFLQAPEGKQKDC